MKAKENGHDSDEVLLSVNDLKVYFPINRGLIFSTTRWGYQGC